MAESFHKALSSSGVTFETGGECSTPDPVFLTLWCIFQSFFPDGTVYFIPRDQVYEFISKNKDLYLKVPANDLHDAAWKTYKKWGVKGSITMGGRRHYWFQQDGNNEVAELFESLIEKQKQELP